MNTSVREELPSRVDRVLGILRQRDLAGLVVYADAGRPGNARYLTNYAPLFGPIILVLAAGGRTALLVTFDWEIPRARQASGLNTIEAGHDMPALLDRALTSTGLAGAAVGLVGSSFIPHTLYKTLVETIGHDPVTVDQDFARLRIIKSPSEQEMLRQAAAATDSAIEAVLGQARPGMTELELAALADSEMKKAGAEGTSFPTSVASGPNSERPVSLSSRRRLEPGDMVIMDLGAMWEGYCADVTRTFVVGPPTERQREVHDIVGHVLAAITAMVRPGIAANSLHKEAIRLLADHDMDRYLPHRVGHGIGLETSLESIDLRADTFPLETGMTFCLEPGVYLPGFGGVKIEDDVVVQSGGPDVISMAPRGLVSV